MPCNSSHMEPTPQEQALRAASDFLRYLVAHNVTNRPSNAQLLQADNIYAKDFGQIEMLCSILREMSTEHLDKFVYDGRNPEARRLADWWERHQKVDAAREAKPPVKVVIEVLLDPKQLTPQQIEHLKGYLHEGIEDTLGHYQENRTEFDFEHNTRIEQ